MASRRSPIGRRQQRGQSPPDGGFRKIGQPKNSSNDRATRGARPERTHATTGHSKVSWGYAASGFVAGLVVPVVLAVQWAPSPPSAQALFDTVTSIVQNPPQHWGCAGSSSPDACDEWLECAKMQEVARIGEETAEEVIRYRSQRVLSSAVLCNQNFLGACGLWWPEQTDLLGPTFTLSPAKDNGYRALCQPLLRVAAAGRRFRQSAMSTLTGQGMSTAPQPQLSQADLESRAQAMLDDEMDKLRQRVNEEGGELVFTPDKQADAEESGMEE